jgi:hypothetical protein
LEYLNLRDDALDCCAAVPEGKCSLFNALVEACAAGSSLQHLDLSGRLPPAPVPAPAPSLSSLSLSPFFLAYDATGLAVLLLWLYPFLSLLSIFFVYAPVCASVLPYS